MYMSTAASTPAFIIRPSLYNVYGEANVTAGLAHSETSQSDSRQEMLKDDIAIHKQNFFFLKDTCFVYASSPLIGYTHIMESILLYLKLNEK